MSVLNPLGFQREAVDKLVISFKKLWRTGNKSLPLVFKSPTGSGKTFMMASFINELNNQPDWDEDKAYIWITFSDDLAMQSKRKFEVYFENTLKNELLTVEDFNRGKLYKNDILFINWQKLVSRSAENRVLRRPESEDEQKESGFYFEDLIENTHKENREFILVVDESHTHKTTELAQNIIDAIKPRIIVDVSATPDHEPTAEAVEECREGVVYVKREEVIKQGLIKEKIAVQTEEDLKRYKQGDLDEILLKLGMSKREELRQQFEALGKKINPLMLIQLPNDDQKLIEIGQKKKEDIVLDFLGNHGVDVEARVALWFDKNKKNLEFISDNDDEVDFLLFKQAAGTGWDCPRAHVLVMFREITSSTFYVQTVGRILRMAEPHNKEDYKNTPDLRTGFLYTNYHRDEIREIETIFGNKPETHFVKIKEEYRKDADGFELQSAFISRVDYGDLASSSHFQISFIKSMEDYFELTKDDILQKLFEKLEKKGLETNPRLTDRLVVDAEFEDIDQMGFEFRMKGGEYDLELSVNDIEKLFNYYCYHVLTEQTDEDARITNIARSWSPLKSALRVWSRKSLKIDSLHFYKIFIKDIMKDARSVFRPAITKALKDYRPVLNKVLNERKKKAEKIDAPIFKIREVHSFTDDYEIVEQSNCVLEDCYLRKEYRGRGNEIRFLNYIDESGKVKWWFKNGDAGKNYFALKYFNTAEERESLFYPDWILRLINGKIGIFDTKFGETLNTQGRGGALGAKLQELGGNYCGGIVLFADGVFKYCDSPDYNDSHPKRNDWKLLSHIL
ncbi:MAG: DEAD/DEAH box helicase family protein [Phycisphaerae bacterium]|jgi:type III restriction enzyme